MRACSTVPAALKVFQHWPVRSATAVLTSASSRGVDQRRASGARRPAVEKARKVPPRRGHGAELFARFGAGGRQRFRGRSTAPMLDLRAQVRHRAGRATVAARPAPALVDRRDRDARGPGRCRGRLAVSRHQGLHGGASRWATSLILFSYFVKSYHLVHDDPCGMFPI
jgi:hypothetical protein